MKISIPVDVNALPNYRLTRYYFFVSPLNEIKTFSRAVAHSSHVARSLLSGSFNAASAYPAQPAEGALLQAHGAAFSNILLQMTKTGKLAICIGNLPHKFRPLSKSLRRKETQQLLKAARNPGFCVEIFPLAWSQSWQVALDVIYVFYFLRSKPSTIGELFLKFLIFWKNIFAFQPIVFRR